MLHLWMYGVDGKFIEVDSVSLYSPYDEEEQALKEAQEWANRYNEPVSIYRYEGHETIEDGELFDEVIPKPVELNLKAGDSIRYCFHKNVKSGVVESVDYSRVVVRSGNTVTTVIESELVPPF